MKNNNKKIETDNSLPLKSEEPLDLTLRPKTWGEYIGKERIKENLKIIIKAAKKRGESPDHFIFYGNTGLGKTTLACLVAKEIGGDIKTTSAPAIERIGDLAALLTNLSEGDVLFIDEFHRLQKIVEEYLYPAMESFKLNLILGKGPMAKTMELNLARFTLIGATTKLALLSPPLRSRFGATFQLDFYEKTDIEKIIQRSSKLLKIKINPEAVQVIASCSRLTPRIANRLLKRVRDFSQVKGEKIITKKTAQKTLEFLEIDEVGLGPGDRKILEVIIKKFKGGPAGLQALAAASSEEEYTILNIYEPYLMQIGFIERTRQGRTATNLAYQHLKVHLFQKKIF